MIRLSNIIFVIGILALCSCEKAIYEEDDTRSEGTVNISLSPYTTASMTRSGDDEPSQPPKYACERYNLTIFNSDGEKVTAVAQKNTDEDFGKMTFRLPQGAYTIVAIGHNKENSVPISNMDKIDFSGGLTDVFYTSQSLKVGEENQDVSLLLKRIVAAFELIALDECPDSIVKLHFKYTGGSQNFSPTTGYGCTKSTQKEDRDINPYGRYVIYTFPRQDSNTLSVTVSGLNEGGETIFERYFEDVPIEANTLTSYTGNLFENGLITNKSLVDIVVDRNYGKINNYTY